MVDPTFGGAEHKREEVREELDELYQELDVTKAKFWRDVEQLEKERRDLLDQICELLDDWIENKRPEVTDDNGREPLLASVQGHAHRTTLRAHCY